MCDFIAPLYKGDCFSAGSTDVGDVSWQTPTVQLYTATYPAGSPGHSWQNVAFGKTTTAHKGMLLAAEVLAESAVKLFENPDILEKAKAEFSERAKSGYVCPIPDGEKAKIVNI
jgi:aminobenzoyl-glutamate utilization protein B